MISDLYKFHWGFGGLPRPNYPEKYLMVGYFLMDISTPVSCESIIQNAEHLSEGEEIERLIGYNAGSLLITKKLVVFETYGNDPGAETIEITYEDFIDLLKSWQMFLNAGPTNDVP